MNILLQHNFDDGDDDQHDGALLLICKFLPFVAAATVPGFWGYARARAVPSSGGECLFPRATCGIPLGPAGLIVLKKFEFCRILLLLHLLVLRN